MHNSLSAATACLESAPGMLRSIVTQPAEEKVMLLVFALLVLPALPHRETLTRAVHRRVIERDPLRVAEGRAQ